MTEGARQRLGRQVRTRRRQLGRSVNEASKLAEVNPKTWQALERGTRTIRDHSYVGIEQALQWKPGSIEAVIDGGEPTPADQSPPTQAPDDSQYRDPRTGELYTDEVDRQLWAMDLLPEETRRRLIIMARVERQAAQYEDQETSGHSPRRAG